MNAFRPDPSSDETAHFSEDDGVEDGRAHAALAVVRLVAIEEVHQFPGDQKIHWAICWNIFLKITEVTRFVTKNTVLNLTKYELDCYKNTVLNLTKYGLDYNLGNYDFPQKTSGHSGYSTLQWFYTCQNGYPRWLRGGVMAK
jgi:hypothetical protein